MKEYIISSVKKVPRWRTDKDYCLRLNLIGIAVITTMFPRVVTLGFWFAKAKDGQRDAMQNNADMVFTAIFLLLVVLSRVTKEEQKDFPFLWNRPTFFNIGVVLLLGYLIGLLVQSMMLR